MFCVECGSEEKLYGSLCKRCFLRKSTSSTLPGSVSIELCAHCGAMKDGKSWRDVRGMDEAIEHELRKELKLGDGFALEKLTTEGEWVDEREMEARVTVETRFDDLPARSAHSVHVHVKPGVCQRCSMQHGSYYESIIQVRRAGRSKLDGDEIWGIVSMVEGRVSQTDVPNKGLFLSKKEEVHGGIDFYLSQNEAGKRIARELARALGGQVSESGRLAGVRDGRDFYRMTYLVRLPEYRRDDIIEVGDRVYLVEDLSSSSVRLLDMGSHETVHLKHKDLEGARIIGSAEDAQETTFVYEEGDDIQVLDPDTMAPVVVKRPQGYGEHGETVLVFKTIDSMYILPYPD